jgi:hypothetical protein
MQRSDQLCRHGKSADAEVYAVTALQKAESFAPPDTRLAVTRHYLGTVYQELRSAAKLTRREEAARGGAWASLVLYPLSSFSSMDIAFNENQCGFCCVRTRR